ncbi:MAG: hypothetical protein ACOC6N_00790 [archaeon]
MFMDFNVEEWGTRPKVGKGFGANVNGKWCSFLETKKGAYRGDHIHPYDQYTVLLGGSAIVVTEIDDKLKEHILKENTVHKTPRGVPHILIPLEDTVLYEWWDGPYEGEPCPGVFDEYKKNRVGPRD